MIGNDNRILQLKLSYTLSASIRNPKVYPNATPTFKKTCLKAPTDPDNVVGVTENVY